MRLKKLILSLSKVIATLMLSSTFGFSEENTTKIGEAITTANENFMAVFNQGDAAGLAALYTENGQLLPSQSDFVTGRSAIQEFWQGAMDMGTKSVKLETVDVEGCGKTAYEVGKYTLFADGEQMIDKGKYIVIWKKEDGKWKLHRDIFNTSIPAPK